MSEDESTESGEWVERRLTDEEADRFEELLSKLETERSAQFENQGMSNQPAAYTSLIADNPRSYFEERYRSESGDDNGK